VHTLALTDGGFVYSFGGGSYGQLGVKDQRVNDWEHIAGMKEMRSKSIIIVFFSK